MQRLRRRCTAQALSWLPGLRIQYVTLTLLMSIVLSHLNTLLVFGDLVGILLIYDVGSKAHRSSNVHVDYVNVAGPPHIQDES